MERVCRKPTARRKSSGKFSGPLRRGEGGGQAINGPIPLTVTKIRIAVKCWVSGFSSAWYGADF